MITSEISQVPDMARVTFTFALADLDGHSVAVVGEFNNWDPAAAVLVRDNGAVSVTMELPIGRRYRFRYLRDDGAWFNDEAADDYDNNDHGGQDSILDLHTRPLQAASPAPAPVQAVPATTVPAKADQATAASPGVASPQAPLIEARAGGLRPADGPPDTLAPGALASTGAEQRA